MARKAAIGEAKARIEAAIGGGCSREEAERLEAEYQKRLKDEADAKVAAEAVPEPAEAAEVTEDAAPMSAIEAIAVGADRVA